MTNTTRPAEEEGGKPAAFMWQHDETGRIGFIDPWQVENGWQEANPRLKIVAPLYRHPAAPGAAAAAPSQAQVVAGADAVARGLWTEEERKDFVLRHRERQLAAEFQRDAK